jgi:hypothetical protein
MPLDSSRCLALGQRGKPQIWLDNPQLGPDILRIFCLDTWVHNDVLARDPVDGCSDLVLVSRLQRIHDAKDLGRVAARGSGIGENSADGLLGVDDEDGADGEGLE